MRATWRRWRGAIQQVLAACQSHGVPCGITAGVDDIAERIEQGFRMFIVSDPAAVTAGRAARGGSRRFVPVGRVFSPWDVIGALACQHRERSVATA